MQKLFVLVGLVGLGVALFGTTANADPQRREAPAAPNDRKVEDPPGMVTVKYGVEGGGMTSKQLQAAQYYVCGNALFGDPAPNQKKACYLASGAKLGDEGEHITTPGPECVRVNVKYVALNGASKERNFCPGRLVSCTNAVFGADPAIGVVKHCESAGKSHAEGALFITTLPSTPNQTCLCGGKSLTELREASPEIRDSFHD